MRRFAGGMSAALGEAAAEDRADEADMVESCEFERERVLMFTDSTSSEFKSDSAESEAGVSGPILK